MLKIRQLDSLNYTRSLQISFPHLLSLLMTENRKEPWWWPILKIACIKWQMLCIFLFCSYILYVEVFISLPKTMPLDRGSPQRWFQATWQQFAWQGSDHMAEEHELALHRYREQSRVHISYCHHFATELHTRVLHTSFNWPQNDLPCFGIYFAYSKVCLITSGLTVFLLLMCRCQRPIYSMWPVCQGGDQFPVHLPHFWGHHSLPLNPRSQAPCQVYNICVWDRGE